jgi:hypothetical protein
MLDLVVGGHVSDDTPWEGWEVPGRPVTTILRGRGLLEFLVAQRGLTRDDAYSLISVAADFAVTQVVDIRQGVHGAIAKNLFLPAAHSLAHEDARR